MRVAVLSIYDSKSEMFSEPQFVAAVGQGVRSFSDAVNDGKSLYAKHPDHFTLFHIAWYDTQSGAFENVSPVESLGTGVTFVTSDPRQLSLLREQA